MNKEQEKQFKERIKEMAKLELANSFTDNLMETLNSAFIFKYVDTLEKQNQEYKEVIDKAIEYIENYRDYQDILIGRTKFESGKFFTEDILREENITKLLDILKEVE